MKHVEFAPEVSQYFKNLVPTLCNLGYFSYLESSKNYVDKLTIGIETNLPKCLHKPAPAHFDKDQEDMHYATFKVNKQTTWYVFFTKYSENNTTIYLVQRIENNHTIAHYL